MIKAIIEGIVERKTPVILTPTDFKDERSRKIVSENFMRVSDLPSLYCDLERSNTEFGNDTVRYRTLLLAGAVLNYELVERKKYKIHVGSRKIGKSWGIPIGMMEYKIFERSGHYAEHENIANNFFILADYLSETSEYTG